MRVTCPKCDAKFKVPDKALGTSGRKLRCGKCSHQWFQAPPTAEEKAAEAAREKAKRTKAKAPEPAPEPQASRAPEEVPVEDPPPEPEDEVESDADPVEDDLADDPPPLGDVSRFRPRSSSMRKRQPIGLYLLLANLVLIPAILLLGRDSLVAAWPASSLLYDTVGLHVPVPGEGLVLQNVYAQRRREGSIDVLVVAGEIRNPSQEIRSLPALQGAILNEAGNEVQHWLFTAEAQLITQGETVPFTSEFAAPGPGAARVNVTFTSERPEAGLGY